MLAVKGISLGLSLRKSKELLYKLIQAGSVLDLCKWHKMEQIVESDE